MEQINAILLIHTASDTADLICDFITYSEEHNILCNGIKNALDNIEKITKHCEHREDYEECEECEGCKECEHRENCINCDTCINCTNNIIIIGIPVISVLFNWKLLFHDITKLNRLHVFDARSCSCNVIPDEILFVRQGMRAINLSKNDICYICPLCLHNNFICTSNIIYNDGPIHITISYTGEGQRTILSII